VRRGELPACDDGEQESDAEQHADERPLDSAAVLIGVESEDAFDPVRPGDR
jgi:hypothetical protein